VDQRAGFAGFGATDLGREVYFSPPVPEGDRRRKRFELMPHRISRLRPPAGPYPDGPRALKIKAESTVAHKIAIANTM